MEKAGEQAVLPQGRADESNIETQIVTFPHMIEGLRSRRIKAEIDFIYAAAHLKLIRAAIDIGAEADRILAESHQRLPTIEFRAND